MPELVAEAATAQHIGDRQRQEDALIAHVPGGEGPGIAVLSDGMGGHDDGDLASRILVSEMFGELFLSAARQPLTQRGGDALFRAALDSANTRLHQHIGAGCISDDTGGTLVSVVLDEGRLRWLSVGDSLLYLCRGGSVKQLNQLHSMAAQLDLMVAQGAMDQSAARSHPHRHCLTSAVTGRQIPRIDCPDQALALRAEDTVLLASDGLNVLRSAEIAKLVARHAGHGSAAIARALVAAVGAKAAPDQDNVSVVVIRVSAAPPSAPPLTARLSALALPLRGLLGRAAGAWGDGLRAMTRGTRL
ncbi:PP2C family protein-serine/threonine phosphatase [Maliponia aquimaris]|uniref:PPM-type phosphatase domain-containing protein n=1 Tax=Maliponia aquimaris TaxID=1673631 RepID=A0A238L5Q7_9RHOB|nr:protein phosphatase 2C domain-containing protein [Maliponia aquimaris]SMX50141.1 Putative protein phosphatase 2C-type [Maliponia aquimaris]